MKKFSYSSSLALAKINLVETVLCLEKNGVSREVGQLYNPIQLDRTQKLHRVSLRFIFDHGWY